MARSQRSLRVSVTTVRFLFAIALSLASIGAFSSDSLPAPSLPIEVGGAFVTEADVQAALRLRANLLKDFAPADRRQRAIEMLIAERVLYEGLRSGAVALPSQVFQGVEAARRQVVRDIYASAGFVPPEVSAEDIEAHVAKNPHAYSVRRTYRFHEIAIDTPADSPPVAEFVASLARVDSGSFLDVVDDGVRRLVVAGVDARHELRWERSDALEEGLRARLAALDAADAGGVDVRRAGELLQVIVLVESVASPLDPEGVRSLIVERIVADAFVDHRAARLAAVAAAILAPEPPEQARDGERLAASLGATGDSGVDDSPGSGDRARGASGGAEDSAVRPITEALAMREPGIGGLVASESYAPSGPVGMRLIALSLASAVLPASAFTWLLWARLHGRRREKLQSLRRLRFPETRSFVVVASGTALVVLLAPVAWVLEAVPQRLPLLQSLVLVFGGCVLGGGAAWLWFRAETAKENAAIEQMLAKYPDNPALAERNAAFAVSGRSRLLLIAGLCAFYIVALRVAIG